LSTHFVAALIGAASIAGVACEAAAQAQEAPLTRERALERALVDDPSVAASEAARRAADASVRQAGRWSNPTLEVTRENFEGSGVYAGSERAETTYGLRQPLELGGDRGARRAIAESDRSLARIGADLQRLDVAEEVEHAFIDAQAAEAARIVADERLAVAHELANAVRRRVEAARDPFMAGSRAQARLAEAEIEAESARRAAIAARGRLASYWNGEGDFTIELVSFDHFGETPIEVLESEAPDLALAEARAGRADAQLRLERARQIPNVDLQAGLREFSDTDDTALVVGVAVPLQIWDRNSDNVSRARAERDRAGHLREAHARTLGRQRAMLAAQLDTARLEVEGLDARVIPSSEEALSFARDGYARGAFSYIDVLEAQRALTEARLRRIASFRSYHRALASLARLAGARAEEISP
jgi:cobalt-zinc-cadmium efflux system outer membrane protein